MLAGAARMTDDEPCCEPGRCDSGRLRLGGVLLAAGEGQRLGGRPKGLITVEGEPLIERNLRLLHSVGLDELVVVTGHFHSQLAPMLTQLIADVERMPVIEVTQPGDAHEQSDSLRLGVNALSADLDAIMVLPVDMPALTRADLVAVIGAYKHAPEEIEFVGPSVEDRPGNPVLFSQRIAQQIAMGVGEFGSGAWRHQQPEWLLEWPTDNLNYVDDIDTPADLARWAQ